MSTNSQTESEKQSWLLTYLPDIYAKDPFLKGFLRIFSGILETTDRKIDHSHAYFNPCLTPKIFLPWLGTWVDLVLDENLPEAQQRELIRRAADLYRWRGTRRGLHDYLTIYLGSEPQIIEHGIDDSSDDKPFHFTVNLGNVNLTESKKQQVRQIIEQEKPAHTTYTLLPE